MYKIFVNEKTLTLSKKEVEGAENILFTNKKTFDIAFDILYNTQKKAVNIYYPDKKRIWNKFQEYALPVYAAGGLVKNKEKQYLFIKRNSIWDLPKGHVEKKETFEEAAVREVEEECGISNLKLGKFIAITYHVYFDDRYYLKTVYWYKMKYQGNSKPNPQAEENIEIADWFSKDKIPALMENTYENIRLLVNRFIL